MANASDYLEQQIFNHIFRYATFSKPATIAIGLCGSPPTDSGYTELPDANNYARIPNVSGDPLWSAHGVGGPGSNASELSFNAATGDWGWVSGVIITDDATYNSGNLLLHGALTTPKYVQNGDTFKFATGDLDVTIS
jgi:hypothetical protein